MALEEVFTLVLSQCRINRSWRDTLASHMCYLSSLPHSIGFLENVRNRYIILTSSTSFPAKIALFFLFGFKFSGHINMNQPLISHNVILIILFFFFTSE